MTKYSENHIIHSGITNAIVKGNLELFKDITIQHSDLVDFKAITSLMLFQEKDYAPLKYHYITTKEYFYFIEFIPEKYLQHITCLNITGLQINSLMPIRNMRNLLYITCVNNQLTSLEGIEKLSKLQHLMCGHNQITKLEPIKDLDSLMYLHCGGNPLDEINNSTSYKSFMLESIRHHYKNS